MTDTALLLETSLQNFRENECRNTQLNYFMLICMPYAPGGAGNERLLQVLNDYIKTHGLNEEATIQKIVQEGRREISMQPAPQTSLLLAPAAEKVGMAINQSTSSFLRALVHKNLLFVLCHSV